LANLTGKTMDTWQDDAAAMNDKEPFSVEAQYASLMPEVKKDSDSENQTPRGIALIGAAMLGAAGFLRWKGMV
ncbi:MAG: hypothetical protein H7Y01_00835, partial [Ferruginibacter sp.]|nr:hypothetical protein [Chitinophagaceae bacterium]